jgi:hypothetical protein
MKGDTIGNGQPVPCPGQPQPWRNWASGAQVPSEQGIREEVSMSNVEQFKKAVAEAGAVAIRVIRRPDGSERLVIQTLGGLIKREVPLRGDLSQDVQAATTSAKEIVASARYLTSPPARTLTSHTTFDRSVEPPEPLPSRPARRP